MPSTGQAHSRCLINIHGQERRKALPTETTTLPCSSLEPWWGIEASAKAPWRRASERVRRLHWAGVRAGYANSPGTQLLAVLAGCGAPVHHPGASHSRKAQPLLLPDHFITDLAAAGWDCQMTFPCDPEWGWGPGEQISPVRTAEATPWALCMGYPGRPILSLIQPTPLPLHHFGSLCSVVSIGSGLVSAISIPGKPRVSKPAGP